MSVTKYYTVKGKIIGERVGTGGLRRYGLDAQGNVVTTFAPGTGTVENTYRYKPYGQQWVKTGTAPDPLFKWNGASGYRQTNANYSSIYVRRRHYDDSGYSGRWTTLDRFWPQTYRYAANAPVYLVDPTGLQAIPPMAGSFGAQNHYVYVLCNSCTSNYSPACQQACNNAANNYNNGPCGHHYYSPWGWGPFGNAGPYNGREIIPLPPPLIPPPQITPRPPTGRDCVNKAFNDLVVPPVFSPGTCQVCCKQSCDPGCLASCGWANFLFLEIKAGEFWEEKDEESKVP